MAFSRSKTFLTTLSVGSHDVSASHFLKRSLNKREGGASPSGDVMARHRHFGGDRFYSPNKTQFEGKKISRYTTAHMKDN